MNGMCLTAVKEKRFVFVPSREAIGYYDSLMKSICAFDKDYIVYLEVGAVATLLAWDLAKLGYQALDVGDFYKRYTKI